MGCPEVKIIGHIETPFREKFGVPRQAGLVDYEARIVFEPEYRVAEAVRGLEEFEYLWLIWQFHLNTTDVTWSPTVRPPRLGGNRRVGVFATRSPYRPNPIGLSAVRLLRIERGPSLIVSGADLVDGTPILDIKPYITYADSHSEARCGYAQEAPVDELRVEDPQGFLLQLPEESRQALLETLRLDPRPRYQHDAARVYSMPFDRWVIRFSVDGDRCSLLSVD